jgi:excisionase family DNA binding protein
MSAEGCEVPSAAPDLPELWPVSRVAELLGVSSQLVYKLMDRGELPYVKIASCRRIRRDEVARLVERGTVERA